MLSLATLEFRRRKLHSP